MKHTAETQNAELRKHLKQSIEEVRSLNAEKEELERNIQDLKLEVGMKQVAYDNCWDDRKRLEHEINVYKSVISTMIKTIIEDARDSSI